MDFLKDQCIISLTISPHVMWMGKCKCDPLSRDFIIWQGGGLYHKLG